MTKPKSLEELLALPDSCTIRELPLLEQAAEMARRLQAVAKLHSEHRNGDCVVCDVSGYPCPTMRVLKGEIE